MTQETVFLNGRIVGELIDGTLVKRVRGSVHMLRNPRGWALDAEVLHQARAHGAVAVRVEDTETGCAYVASVDRFDADGIPIDRGYGRQIALPLHFWQRQGAPESRPQAVQAALFAAIER